MSSGYNFNKEFNKGDRSDVKSINEEYDDTPAVAAVKMKRSRYVKSMRGNRQHGQNADYLMDQLSSMLSFNPRSNQCRNKLRCSTRDEKMRRNRLTGGAWMRADKNMNQKVLSATKFDTRQDRNLSNGFKSMTSGMNNNESEILTGGNAIKDLQARAIMSQQGPRKDKRNVKIFKSGIISQ